MNCFNETPNWNIISKIEEKEDAKIRVLEVGCDCGATLIAIKNKYVNASVHGIEINKQSAEIAARYFDVKRQNIEDQELEYAYNSFAYIIFDNFLEHLIEPEKIVAYCRNYLKDTGYVISRILNLQHVSIVRELINGNFTYRDTGVPDRTHIHMFTYNEIVKMFEKCSYQINDMDCVVIKNEGDDAYIDEIMKLSSMKERAMFEASQYVVKARPVDNLFFKSSPLEQFQRFVNDIVNRPYMGEIHLTKYLVDELVQAFGYVYFDIEKNVAFQTGLLNDYIPEASEDDMKKMKFS